MTHYEYAVVPSRVEIDQWCSWIDGNPAEANWEKYYLFHLDTGEGLLRRVIVDSRHESPTTMYHIVPKEVMPESKDDAYKMSRQMKQMTAFVLWMGEAYD